uniref:Zinc finger PHD-type domain-containing protein n=1 Tax=Amphimedon queenslandica TaxID=400682 RepID=A0A1X7VWY9_AMPQE
MAKVEEVVPLKQSKSPKTTSSSDTTQPSPDHVSPKPQSLDASSCKPLSDSPNSPTKSQDAIRCVCQNNSESGLMLAYEECGNWLHSKCVGLSRSVASTFPFACPFCARDLYHQVVSLQSNLSQVNNIVCCLTKSVKLLSQQSVFVKDELASIRLSLTDISIKLNSLATSSSTSIISASLHPPPPHNSFLSSGRPPKAPPPSNTSSSLPSSLPPPPLQTITLPPPFPNPSILPSSSLPSLYILSNP